MTYSDFFRYGDLLRHFYTNSINGKMFPYEAEDDVASPDYMSYIIDLIDHAKNI